MKQIARWFPSAAWMVFIFYMSQQTGQKLNSFLPFFQRFFPSMKGFDWGHFAAYFILACTFYLGMSRQWAGWKGKIAAVLLCVLYGITDEYHQSFVPGRTPDVMDLRNDGIGAALAMLALSIPPVQRWYQRLRYGKMY